MYKGLVVLSEIVGHDTLKPSLLELSEKQGPFLFSGPKCVGKRTVAIALAHRILCKEKGKGCSCPSCRAWGSGHPDFLEIGSTERIKVDDVDRVLEFCSYSPMISETRVVVLDNVENATTEASNRLLKTLEDSAYRFFLITAQPESVLRTLVSRCMPVHFGSLSQDDIATILWKRYGFELPVARVISWLGKEYSGDIFASPGLFIKYRDMVLDFAGFYGKDLLAGFEFVDKVPKEDLPVFCDMMSSVITDLLLIKKGIPQISSADRRKDLENLADKFSDKGLTVALHYLTQIKAHSYLNVNLALRLKNALIKTHSIVREAA